MKPISNPTDLVGKRIAFVTAGYSGKRFIYEKAKSLGVQTTIIDSPDSWARALVELGIITHFIGVDFGQPSAMVIADILEAMRSQNIELDGICTFAELSLPITAKLARALQLPGQDPDVVSLTRDKHKVRKVVAGAGLHEVRSYKIKSFEQVDEAAEFVGFPAVLKPISGADSLGVKRVNSKDELKNALQEAQTIVSNLVVSSGALARLTTPTGSQAGSAIGQLSPPSEQRAERFIQLDLSLEEYLDGPEVDVDLVLYNGELYFASVVDNGPTVEPYFAETWNLCPSILPVSQQQEMLEEALATVKALGFHSGVFHVEERYTTRGPRIIEVNARMGGGPIRLQHKYIYGFDLVVEQLLLALGLPPSQDLCPLRSTLSKPTNMNKSYVSSTPNASKSGTITSTSFLNVVRTKPNLVGLWEFVAPGDIVVGPEEGQPSWLCEVALGGSDGGENLLAEMNEITKHLVDVAHTNCYE
jgi:biotin carboxylase